MTGDATDFFRWALYWSVALFFSDVFGRVGATLFPENEMLQFAVPFLDLFVVISASFVASVGAVIALFGIVDARYAPE